mgnify:CR=1 FL=1
MKEKKAHHLEHYGLDYEDWREDLEADTQVYPTMSACSSCTK